MLPLGQRQEIFSECLGKLLVWIYTNPGWKVRMGEGYVALTDARDEDHDGPHLKDGAHYNKLGQDLDLFIDGEWIKEGSHSAWEAIGKYWKQLNPLCRWGGDLKSKDSNHVSVLVSVDSQGKERY
jgi:hypothetical protein